MPPFDYKIIEHNLKAILVSDQRVISITQPFPLTMHFFIM